MATTREVLRRKRQEEAWSAHMERIRAAEARGEPWPEWRPEEGVGVARCRLASFGRRRCLAGS